MTDDNTFIHDIAVEISRALNLTNPNDLIAKKVIQFAENKDFEKFYSCNYPPKTNKLIS